MSGRLNIDRLVPDGDGAHGATTTITYQVPASFIASRWRRRTLERQMETATVAQYAARGFTVDREASHFHGATFDDDGVLIYHVAVVDDLAASFEAPPSPNV